MQSIERYGVVALCFLIVTMVAVWAWDDQSPQAEEEVARAAEAGMRTSGTRAGQREKNKAGAQTAVSSPSQARFAQRSESEPRSAKRRAGLRSKPEQVSAEPSSGAIIASRSNALTQEAMHARRQEEARIEAERQLEEQEQRRRAWEEQQREASNPASGEARMASQSSEGAAQRGNNTSEKTASKASSTKVQKGSRSGKRGGLRTYVIASGDTLSEIAMNELGTMRRMDEILAVNPGLNADRLPVGVEIQLPSGGVSAGGGSRTPRTAQADPAGAAKGRYVVGPGENLWLIAESVLGNGLRWQEIARLNPSTDPQRLRVGEVLVLPKDASTPSRGRSVPKVANRDQVRSRARGKVL